jgi:hypothetical protein
MFLFLDKIQDLNSEESACSKSISQITLLAIIISSVLAFLYWFLRYGFNDNSIFEIIKTLSVSFCLLILPDFIYRYVKLKKANQIEAWLNSIAFTSVLFLFFLVFLGFFSLLTGIKIIYLLLPLGFILLILFLFDYLINFFKKSDILLIALFIIFSFWAGALIWGAKYHNPLFYEQIILGLAHSDVIFATAVSNLIKTYGIPSTGVDGLPYLYFHWGNNWLFAYLSGLINISTIKFYNLCYPVIFIPFYFKSLLLFVVDFKRYKNFSPRLGWLLFILLFIVYIGRNTFSDLGNEAYLMAVSFSFLLFCIIISALRAVKNDMADRIIHDKLFFYILLPVFIGIIGLCKISVGFLLIGLYGYLFLRMRWYKNNKIFISFIISSLIFIVAYLAASNKGAIEGYNNLSQIAEYIKSWNLFFSIDYLFMWIFIFLFLFQEKVFALFDLKIAFAQKKLLEIEIFLVIALLGLLPGAFLKIAGGSDWYFSDFQKLLGLCFVLAYLPYFIKTKEEPPLSYVGKLKIHFIFIILLIFFSEILFINHYYTQGGSMLVKNIIIRKKILNPAEADIRTREFIKEKFQENGFSGILKSIIPASKLSQQSLSRQQNYKLVKVLEKLGEMKISEKRKTCVYIPKSNKIFWEMNIYKDYNHLRPFVTSTLTGMAMLDGLPEGELVDIYGYYYYKKARDLSGGKAEVKYDNIENIKSAANAKGFSNVIIIKQENDSLVVEKI